MTTLGPHKLPAHSNSMPLGTYTEIITALAASVPHMEIVEYALRGDLDVEQDIRFYAAHGHSQVTLTNILLRVCRVVVPPLTVAAAHIEQCGGKGGGYTVFVCTLKPRDPIFDLIGADEYGIGWQKWKKQI